jgi:glycosyltransferase involved in cell wall biosynthesis
VQIYRTRSIKVLDFYLGIPSRSFVKGILAENKTEIVHYQYAGLLSKRVRAVAQGIPSMRHVYTFNMLIEHLTQDTLFLRLCAPLLERMLAAFCNKCDLITVPTPMLEERLRRLNIKTETMYVSNATGSVALQTADVSPQLRSNFIVLFVGRLHPEKNIPYLLEAFAKHVEDYPESELWIVGQGFLRKRLDELCRRKGIANRVVFKGQIAHDAIANVYRASDVLVLPSTVETQGMVAIEAMSCGKPVIVTDAIISANDLVEPGVTGYIVGHRSAADLTEKLNALAENRVMCQSLGSAGLTRAQKYDTAAVVETLEQSYRQLREELRDDRTSAVKQTGRLYAT